MPRRMIEEAGDENTEGHVVRRKMEEADSAVSEAEGHARRFQVEEAEDSDTEGHISRRR